MENAIGVWLHSFAAQENIMNWPGVGLLRLHISNVIPGEVAHDRDPAHP